MLGLPISDQHSAEALREMVRAEGRPRVGIRMLAIAALLDGLDRTGAARQFGMSRNVLRIWVARYNQDGVSGLVDRWSGGPAPKLSDEQQAQLRATVEAGAELERDGIVAFPVADICGMAERAFGVRHSRSGMQRLLHAIGCSWLVPRPRHPQAEAAAQAAFKTRRPSKKDLPATLATIAAAHPEAARIELWFQDEMRVGQKGTLTRVWGLRGQRAVRRRDLRFSSAYLFGAVCPERGTGAALVLPRVSLWATNQHLAEISQHVAPDAHAALVLDRAGWHSEPGLVVPANITLVGVPPYSPELNPAEALWHEMRRRFFALQVFKDYDAIVDACCVAWNRVQADPAFIRAVTGYTWLPSLKG